MRPRAVDSRVRRRKGLVDSLNAHSLDSSVKEEREVITFHQWNELPAELKTHVLGFLPFQTFRDFMFLSKECYSLASTVKLDINSLILEDMRYVESFEVGRGPPHLCGRHHFRRTICLLVSDKQSEQMSFIDNFSGRCYVERDERGGRIFKSLRHNVKPHCAAFETFFRIIASFRKVKAIRISVDGTNSEIMELLAKKPAGLLKCDVLDMLTERTEFASLFLRLLNPGCELRIRSRRDFYIERILEDPTIFITNVIKFATSISITWKTVVTDEQIVQLQAHSISLKAPRITSRGIIQLLSQWIEGKRKIISIKLNGLRDIRMEDILHGLGSANMQPLVVPTKTIREEVLRSVGVPSSTIIYNVTGDALVAFVDEKSCSLEAFPHHISDYSS